VTEPESTREDPPQPDAPPQPDRRPTLDTLVRKRRTDQAFFLRITRAMQQNRDALERLHR
jgi:hypothetical protein